MHHFNSDGIDIAYLDEGVGEPVLLIHGFGSNAQVNWSGTGWISALVKAGYRVIAIDNRGHGQSEKLYDPRVYEAPFMAQDAVRLLDHLGLERADIMGFSMGARISAFMALHNGERVRSAVFGGLGINMVHGLGGSEAIAAALEANSLNDIADRTGRMFRAFADSTKSDLKALAACIRSSRQKILPEELSQIRTPVLVAVGTRDVIGGSAGALAALIPGALAFDIEGRDHMMAVGDKTYKARVLDFLAARS